MRPEDEIWHSSGTSVFESATTDELWYGLSWHDQAFSVTVLREMIAIGYYVNDPPSRYKCFCEGQ